MFVFVCLSNEVTIYIRLYSPLSLLATEIILIIGTLFLSVYISTYCLSVFLDFLDVSQWRGSFSL